MNAALAALAVLDVALCALVVFSFRHIGALLDQNRRLTAAVLARTPLEAARILRDDPVPASQRRRDRDEDGAPYAPPVGL